MRLTRVTITGADDDVNINDLSVLSQRFPFVEWGILISQSQEGAPRYPSLEWRTYLHPIFNKCSYHLCGYYARRVLSGASIHRWYCPPRMQLNGFGDFILPGLVVAEASPEVEFILQCPDRGAWQRALALGDSLSNVVPFWDQSGGTGQSWHLDEWRHISQSTAKPCGFGGGINELNVEDTIAALCTGVGAARWIDIETGARTGDKFDLGKVERILKLAEPFIRPNPTL